MGFCAERVETLKCPLCHQRIDLRGRRPLTEFACDQCGAHMRVPLCAGEWIIVKHLGCGRYSTVYEAFHRVLLRPVALKIPMPGKSIHAFIKEANAMARIDHPNVVRIHQVASFHGYPFCVMEYVDGQTLEEKMKPTGKIGEFETLCIAEGVACGLAAAWKRGIIHRDIKPPNILVTRDGVVKVADFGLSASSDAPDKAVVGTPWYIAPEVVLGEPIDFRADMYSLGCTMYHMLTGKLPFTDKSITELCTARLKVSPPWLREVDPRFTTATEDLLLRMMRRQPEDRFGSYEELLAAINRAKGILQNTGGSRFRLEDLEDLAVEEHPPIRPEQTYIPALNTRSLSHS
ncbi:MAG: protein kinase [Phycisphaera sp.]|nr:protein kinase [Phycisphaera sp.]